MGKVPSKTCSHDLFDNRLVKWLQILDNRLEDALSKKWRKCPQIFTSDFFPEREYQGVNSWEIN